MPVKWAQLSISLWRFGLLLMAPSEYLPLAFVLPLRGVNVVPFLEMIGLPESIVGLLRESSSGYALTAYAMYKVMSARSQSSAIENLFLLFLVLSGGSLVFHRSPPRPDTPWLWAAPRYWCSTCASTATCPRPRRWRITSKTKWRRRRRNWQSGWRWRRRGFQRKWRRRKSASPGKWRRQRTSCRKNCRKPKTGSLRGRLFSGRKTDDPGAPGRLCTHLPCPKVSPV